MKFQYSGWALENTTVNELANLSEGVPMRLHIPFEPPPVGPCDPPKKPTRKPTGESTPGKLTRKTHQENSPGKLARKLREQGNMIQLEQAHPAWHQTC
jgi:hypothetical protein